MMSSWRPPLALVERLYRKVQAERWHLPADRLADALERSARKAFAREPSASELETYADSLHVADLALACACAEGNEAAWDHFVREFRPTLYRAADAIDPSGGSRELADSLYAELFGLTEREGRRRSHFDYFHGRSSLATWLRAVLSQRHVDRLRSARRFDPLPAEDASAPAAPSPPRSATAGRYVALIRRALLDAVADLAPRDRLRLAWYYAHGLTLAQIGAALGEHEATASRHLTRVRKAVRAGVERRLSERDGLNAAQVAECFESVLEDVQTLDVADLLGSGDATSAQPAAPDARKDGPGQRSKERTERARA